MAEKVLREDSSTATVYLVLSAKWFCDNRSNPISLKLTTEQRLENKWIMEGTMCQQILCLLISIGHIREF